ncbi:MAG: type II toxin-antitoxin system PemK/MazF family toxin [Chloroflexales bacterium]|nr:type II toxin-antitoxin system PemK/MazF family toxin [Chloroflexales bacterium]
MSFPRRGEVYWVRLDPTIGSEIAKARPSVVISNDIGNQYAARVIIAPISTGGTDKVYPFEVLLQAGEGGLRQRSKALLDQIRTVDKSRLERYVGALDQARLDEINRAIRLSLAV